ncbi:MAG: hypothetical protein BWK79_11195 [Beggiatoa sp. IS2]|nr:MAG: hypothetical protein BWK79_11195 [Beggiatoa sp. IS2]
MTKPLPMTLTVSFGLRAKLATQLSALVKVTVAVGVVSLPQSPPQLTNRESVAGSAVNVTLSPRVKAALQVLPQSMPSMSLVTEPLPAPGLVMVNSKSGSKWAMHCFGTLSNTVLGLAVPTQSPSQPTNVKLSAGVAVSDTLVFVG